MKIVIGSDRAGLEMRQHLIKSLGKQGHTLTDVGTDPDKRVGHPAIALLATREYLKGGYDFGILICGSGTGICIAANKVRGIRCALIGNFLSARIARELNKANFIAFGGQTMHPEDAEALAKAYMSYSYKGDVDWVAQWDREIDQIEAKGGG